MPRWGEKQRKDSEVVKSVADELQKIYTENLLPLEQEYKFHEFHSPKLETSDFHSKPMVLLVGQYSTGKTTFIKYLLEQDFPGMIIGPEPTTECFTAIMYGLNDNIIPGNALASDSSKVFRSLSSFGNAFLNRFVCSETTNPVLETVTFIDSPGIISGEDKSFSRGYDFTGVLEWFAEKVDRIIMFFDVFKLDISEEYCRAIQALRGYDEKIRIILNKADMISTQQLMRVYGAMMWSLGKVIDTPEVIPVYIGSFWNQPLQTDDNKKLFELEEKAMLHDLQCLPMNGTLRKLNDLIKRTKLAKIHAYIISCIEEEMPSLFFKERKKRELIRTLADTFWKIQKQLDISPGDFPSVQKMQENLSFHDFSKFPPLRLSLIQKVDEMLFTDFTRLIRLLNQEFMDEGKDRVIKGGVFEAPQNKNTLFTTGAFEGYNLGIGTNQWVVNEYSNKKNCDLIFTGLGPVNGKISGNAAKQEMEKSKLPTSTLAKIWTLADTDKDGQLDKEEFSLAMYLIDVKLKDDVDLPSALPHHFVPPGKWQLVYGK